MAELYVGLISGTSMDGIDAVVVDFAPPCPRLLASQTRGFEPGLQPDLDALRLDPDGFPAARLAWLDATLGDQFATAALSVIEQAGLRASQIRAIGCHGQTVLHRPMSEPPHSLQIGDAHRIAARTGILTIADFRRADLAAGGQGAPLAPLIHHALLGNAEENRIVLNLGGIANITVLPKEGGVRGFDTGPANCFLDAWYRRHQPGRYDENGQWAASGQVDASWLAELLADPYFQLTPPKSTGIEYFSQAWLEARLPIWAGQRPADIQATLAEFTAVSLGRAIQAELPGGAERLLLCGGGAGNADLVRRIGQQLPQATCEPTDAQGLPADFVEAMLFAWLARERLSGRRIDSGPITGAKTPVFLGNVHQPGD